MDIVRDRLTTGYVAGLAASIVQSVINLANVALGVAKVPYYDWAAKILLGHKPITTLETIASQIFEIFLSAGFGIFYVYLLPYIGARNYRLKGILYGLAIMVVNFSIFRLFKVSGFAYSPVLTALGKAFSSAIFGWVLAEGVNWIDRKYDEEQET